MSQTNADHHVAIPHQRRLDRTKRLGAHTHMARLFSKHHDRYHTHKTLGFLALIHFVYRGVVFTAKGDAFEDDSPAFFVACMMTHVLLHVTSFSFSLPQRRNQNAPMIWPAYRAHNAVFATRNVFGAMLVLYSRTSSSRRPAMDHWLLRAALRTLFVWAFMALADLASWYYDRGENATTRGMPYPVWMRKTSVKRIKSFYMQCQFHATLLSVTDPSLSFFSVLPIQLASFAMTLARKHKITTLHWHIIYAVSLWSLYALMVLHPVGPRLALAGILGGIAKEVRQHLRVRKYLLWAMTIAIHDFGSTLLPESIAGSQAGGLVRFTMFVAAARQFVRLGHCFLAELLYNDKAEQTEYTAERDATTTIYRVNQADDTSGMHRGHIVNGHNLAIQSNDATARSKQHSE